MLVRREEVLMGFGRIKYFLGMKITCWKTLILEFGFSLGRRK